MAEMGPSSLLQGHVLFDRFQLDPADRRLLRDGEPVELSARYFDALALLVSEPGKLISKDRFLEQVWRGVPVTDEALTQCIKTLRRQLGDDAAKPRLIETVPKHGYRFIARVEPGTRSAATPMARLSPRSQSPVQRVLSLGAAGTVGGGVAGLAGGMVYGFIGASLPVGPGVGATSVLFVLVCLTGAIALIGAAGVSFGIAAALVWGSGRGIWTILGGATGGLLVGAVVKLLGLDAFSLLFGRSPGDITGAGEGFALGAAVGLAAWLAGRSPLAGSLRRAMALAGFVGGLSGMLIPALGGRMMAGSLDLVARQFPGSNLQFDQLGRLFGEGSFGLVSQLVSGALEGALFGACIVGGMIVARRDQIST
jgi:DNA-binding winged helix-turn-helix (wHTH) protein